jgi:hypothetical protein
MPPVPLDPHLLLVPWRVPHSSLSSNMQNRSTYSPRKAVRWGVKCFFSVYKMHFGRKHELQESMANHSGLILINNYFIQFVKMLAHYSWSKRWLLSLCMENVNWITLLGPFAWLAQLNAIQIPIYDSLPDSLQNRTENVSKVQANVRVAGQCYIFDPAFCMIGSTQCTILYRRISRTEAKESILTLQGLMVTEITEGGTQKHLSC